MNRRTAVFGLLAIAVMIVAAVVFLSGRLSEHPAAAPPGGDSSSSAAPYVPCNSCDARHQRLEKERSGTD
jgi:hypothetical protein